MTSSVIASGARQSSNTLMEFASLHTTLTRPAHFLRGRNDNHLIPWLLVYFPHRQFHPKRASVPNLALDRHAAAVLFDDELH